jgi:autotransporter-associated beta strand protein
MGTASTFLLGIADTAHNNADTVTAVFDNLGTMRSLFASVGAKNYLPVTTALSIAPSGTLDLSGGSQQVASLSDQTPGSRGGSIINSGTATSVLTLSPSGGSTTFSGMIQGGGALGRISLVMGGSGTQLLSGSNTYTGTTTISQGELVVDGSLISPVTIQSGGTLGGSGSLGNVTVNAGGTLAPGDPLGTSHLSGNLVLASSASMDFDLDGIPTDDEISMSPGTATFNGQQFSDFHFAWTAGFGPGIYTLIDAQSITGLASTSGMIDGYPAMLSVQGGDALVLNVVPESPTPILLAAGAVGLAGFGWRRRAAKLVGLR